MFTPPRSPLALLFLIPPLLILALVTPAHAEETPTEVDRYSLLTLGVDGLTLGLFLAGAAAEGPGGRDTDASLALMGVGWSGLTLGTPIVHLAMANWKSFGVSLLLRATVPVATAGIAVATADCDGLLCERSISAGC